MKKLQAVVYIIIIVSIYLIGAETIDLMDQDATQYMTIAQNMHYSGDYMTVKWRDDYNYLDKPPLLFWLSSLFFSVFGVNHFAYRLPSILITLLGIFSTYKLGKKLYNEQAGIFASIIYATGLGIIIFNHDVRTDTILTGLVIFTIWQLWSYIEERKVLNFILAFVSIGFAIMAKGPLGLLIPMLAIGPQLIISKRWKDIFRWEWIPGLIIVLIVLLPMIISTYNQHGMHGIKFHFWSQSFGRITGESKWEDTTGPFFFLHSFLWSFLPWSFLAVIAYVKKWISMFRENKNGEIITLSGITLVFIAMSMATYKLPHYVFVVYPLIAILTGNYIQFKAKNIKWNGFGKPVYITQLIINIFLWIATGLIFFVFDTPSMFVMISLAIVLFFFIYSLLNQGTKHFKVFSSTFATIIGVSLMLNIYFYPSMNKYQARVVAGEYLREKEIPAENVLIYPQDIHKPTIDVYSHQLNLRTNNFGIVDSLVKEREELYIFTDIKGLNQLKEENIPFEVEKEFGDFQISLLNLKFINPNTRNNELKDLFLLKSNTKTQVSSPGNINQ